MSLIEKEYALEKAENQYYLNVINEQTKNEIIKFIKSLPSADVQPVVHGEWIPVTGVDRASKVFPYTERVWVDATEPDEIDAVKCSVCGEVFDFADARNWCTECGAKNKQRSKQ